MPNGEFAHATDEAAFSSDNGVSFLWQPIANATAVPVALLVAAGGLVLGLLGTRKFEVGQGEKMDLSKARLRQSSFALATYDNVSFASANLSVSNLFGARFNRSDFSGANLENATAVGTYFGASKLAGAKLEGANFSGADLSLVQGLTQSQLNQACGDETTRLPKGQTIPHCS